MNSTRELYMEERRRTILERVESQGRVAVGDLSEEFGVSEATIRADLNALSRDGLVVRTHGGAVQGGGRLYDLALATRRQRHVHEKSSIGIAAASLVAEGDSIFLDSSSTALAIAQQLKHRRSISVITNSLAVAQELLDVVGVSVIVVGGNLQRETLSMVGNESLALVEKYNIQKGFFGAHGIAIPEGLTDVSAEEAAFKIPVVQKCRQAIAVLDSTKWGKVGLASFAAIDDFDIVISNTGAPAASVERVRAAGTEVVLV
ncbi:MAG: DeoR/GlpR transcriptional regulator [Caldilineales bacterium]|nr:DeoR/GlpR transcriptional regulator [Caldilineales bacterium]